MTSTSKTIIFFGTDSFSLSALQHLITAGYTIGAVVTKPDARSGRGQQLTAPAVKQLAQQHDIPVWQPTNIREIIEPVSQFNDPVGILSSYGRIVPQEIIDLFTPGIINIHPSLLPLYRGPSPIESAILNGDQETGVSIMLLSLAMDAGPIYVQKSYPLDGSETQPMLYETLARLGSEQLIEHLPAIIDGSLTPTEQAGEPTYSRLLQKTDALVDPLSRPAEMITRHIRAYLTFPKTKLTLLDQLVTVTAAHVSNERTSPLDVTCQDGMYLVIDELIAPSGRRMDGQAFLNGYN